MMMVLVRELGVASIPKRMCDSPILLCTASTWHLLLTKMVQILTDYGHTTVNSLIAGSLINAALLVLVEWTIDLKLGLISMSGYGVSFQRSTSLTWAPCKIEDSSAQHCESRVILVNSACASALNIFD